MSLNASADVAKTAAASIVERMLNDDGKVCAKVHKGSSGGHRDSHRSDRGGEPFPLAYLSSLSLT